MNGKNWSSRNRGRVTTGDSAAERDFPQPRRTYDVPIDRGLGNVVGDGNVQNVYIGDPAQGVGVGAIRVGAVPRRANCFRDRAVLVPLAASLPEHREGVPGTRGAAAQVLSGLGGVGKTQIAAQHAEQQWQAKEIDLLIWITASSREAIITGYANASKRVLQLPDAALLDAAMRLLDWLPGTGKKWLIVLDDLQHPGDLKGLWPPATATGQVVITTRRRDAALTRTDHTLIDVGVFTAEDSLAYLESALNYAPDLIDTAAELADDLGHLPLALAQAAAYMTDRGLSCDEYRRRLADRRKTLHDVFPTPDELPDDHSHTVAATWSLSIDLADRLRPKGLARPLLEAAALLDPNGIAVDVFTSKSLVGYLGRRTGSPVVADDVRDALHVLHRLNLILLDATQPHRAVRIHQLVQRATREHELSRAHREVLALVCADALVEVWPEIERSPEYAQMLRANTDIVRDIADGGLWRPRLHGVLLRAARSLGQAGLVEAAVSRCADLHDRAQGVLGADHPDTLTIRNDLAYWQGRAGDPAGAATAFDGLLADRLRILGPDHPDTLTTRNNLARWRGESGNPAGAVAALEQLLTDRRRILGEEHPHTLSTQGNLARWQGEAGDPAGAASVFAQLLSEQLRVVGPDHPDTLAARHNLAYWRGEAGDPAGAVSALEQLLPDQVRVLGPDHPSPLLTRGSIARWLGEGGDPRKAVSALEELLSDRLRILGPDHLHTLTTRGSLARWRGRAGDPAAAVTALEDLSADQLRVLGPDHPSTLTVRTYLADWLGEAGDPAAAVTALDRLITDQLRVLGPDHPATLTARASLAHWRGKSGDVSGAAAAFDDLLRDRLRILTPSHPEIARTRAKLEHWRVKLADGVE
ncbi:tetratricopeptide repeat protein [Amycolatopsis sp. NPDC049159]|uniref:tetratricopeptide repeat protein n=1 Tax=Amycolatopsis sp. NPDC049159 TaxID=3157210 RepID=UPI0033F1B7B0